MKNTTSSRIRPAFRRWLEIAVYSLFGALLAMPLGNGVDNLLNAMLGSLSKPAPALATIVYWSIIAVSLWFIFQQSGTRARHFKWLVVFPPTLTAVPMGMWLFTVLVRYCEKKLWFSLGGARWSNPLILLSSIFSALVLLAYLAALVIKAFKHRKPAVLSNQTVTIEDLMNLPFDRIREWLSSEMSIREGSKDFFRSTERAKRVWQALRTNRNDGADRELRQTVVIQGQYGAGKSSIVQLVENLAESPRDEQYIFAHVNCWGFSSLAAQEHILEQAIKELSKFVDCLALRQLPSEYSEAIRETNKLLGALTSLFTGKISPVEQLQRITPVLRAIHAQLVVVIEDTDRNGPDFDQKHIEAMLHNFRSVERVSFVLTAGAESRIDFPKVAEQIIFLTPPPEQVVLTLFDRVRDHCRENYSVLDPTSTEGAPRNRPTNLQEEAVAGHLANSMFGYRHPEWATAIAKMVNTPRMIKLTLSAVLTRWESLSGEVDLDELIMLTALRYCASNVFTFFGNHYQEFKTLESRQSDTLKIPEQVESKKERVTYLKEQWLLAINKYGYDPHTIGTILGELVYSSVIITGRISWAKGNRCQSIGSTRGDTYWERLTADIVSPFEIRDQDVLNTIYSAATGDGIKTMGGRFAESGEFAELVLFFEKFSRRLKEEDVLQISSVAIRKMRPLRHVRTPFESTPLSALSEWLTIRLPYNDPRMLEWLKSEIAACLPFGLVDANFLYFRFATDRFDTDALVALRQHFVENVRKHFESISTKDFSECFDTSYPFSFGHLVRIDRKNYPAGFLTKPHDWAWLSKLVLGGMKNYPQVLIPQTMIAFGDFGPEGQMPTWFKYDVDALKEFFGDQFSEALLLLTQELNYSPESDSWFKFAGPLGTNEAKRLLHDSV